MAPRTNKRRGRPARSNRPGKKPGKVSSNFRKKVEKVIKQEAETKYVAQTIVQDGYVLGDIQGQINQSRLQLLFPQVGRGTGINSRIGNSIEPVKLRATVQYYFHTAPAGAGGPVNQTTTAVAASGLYEVRQVCVQPKFSKGYSDWLQNNTSLTHGKLLNAGDGSSVPPNSADPMNLNYPIFTNAFTPIRGNKKIMMGKNEGLVFGSTEYPLAMIRAQDTQHFDIKCPKVIKYDQESGGPSPDSGANVTYPTNFLPLHGVYAGVLANSGATSLVTAPSKSYNDLIGTKTTAGPLGYSWTTPILRYNLRVELWFKDV